MTMPPTDHLVWYRATTLNERLAAGHSGSVTATEDDLARFRLQSWKTQPPFNDESYFAQRLALDGLTELQLRQILREPLKAIPKRFSPPPTWMAEVIAALAEPCALDLRSLLSDKLNRNPTTGFLTAAAPFIARALWRFAAGIAELTKHYAALPFDPTTISKILFAHLPQQLFEMLNRTMALELNIARLREALAGATAEERFQDFIARLGQPDSLHSFLQEYPVLARALHEQTQRWVNVSLEFLARLCCDWEAIKVTFSPDREPGELIAVKGGIADTHRGGQSVLLLKFSSGFRLVYKPKSLSVDAHFQQLLQWLNARGAEPSFPNLTVLERESYGWVEHVKAQACETKEEVQRFYQRQGGYLALLSLLEATDFHAGNLIACGEFPFLIDLEALFHPRRRRLIDSHAADRRARHAISHSVLRLGLLPERVWGNSENDGVDTSGLGTVDDQLTPHALPQWEDIGTDTMHLARKRKRIHADKNRPRLGDEAVNVLDYRDEILAGFAAMYALLHAQREELLADNGPLARFANDDVSVFLRSMRTYRRLLRESFHPDVLRDALDRDRLFDLLWVEVVDDPDLLKVISVERADLLRGDIPMFTARPASCDLWINGHERLTDFFAAPSLSFVQQRVQQLSREDYERQAWFIRASLATLPRKEEPSLPAPTHTAITSREALHAAAQAIGDRLETIALRGTDDATWLGLMQEPGRAWFIDALGFDLDAGLPGVALFLAYLGARTKQERYTALAAAALTTMQQQMAERCDEVTMLGTFDGWGGAIYTLTHLGVLWQRADLLAEAKAIAERVPEWLAEDDVYTVYGGAAGCIAALRCLAHVAPSERVTAAALQCGAHLLKHQTITEASFLHGTTGIAWALRTLHDWTGQERFRAAAQALSPTPLVAALQCERGRNHSLLNGDAGGLERLLQERAPEWEAQLQAQTARLLASIAQHGWRCGTPLAVETPGLLTGLAGIGWQLLRVAEPDIVPSVLLLEPPAMAAKMRPERSHRGTAKN